MVAPFVAELRKACSAERLTTYAPLGSSDLDIAVDYFWNVALSEALYPALSALEISLRNSIHAAATARYESEYWFDRPGLLKFRQPDEVAATRDTLARRNKPKTAGRIIAELRFGFWTTLLSDPYHSSFWMPRKAQILKASFPNMTNADRIRQDIWRRYNRLRFLRNRVFHFEPICYQPNLADQHRQILEAIGWINPTLKDSVALANRFSVVYRDGRLEVEQRLLQYLGIS